MADLGLLLAVLCLGLAAGVSYSRSGGARESRQSQPVPTEAVRDVRPRAIGRPAAASSHSDSISVDGGFSFRAEETAPGATYRPVSGARFDSAGGTSLDFVPAGEGSGGGGTVYDPQSAVQESANHPVSSRPQQEGGPSASATASDRVVRVRPDNVATLARSVAAGALLLGVRSATETILFDVGVPGARRLPDDISGKWAWAGSCDEVDIEISQLPGEPGSVRGVGAAGADSRVGWVVPSAACGSGRESRNTWVRLSSRDGVPAGVESLRAVGRAPCGSAISCDWFAGASVGGKVVAVLARGGGDHWIWLGGS